MLDIKNLITVMKEKLDNLNFEYSSKLSKTYSNINIFENNDVIFITNLEFVENLEVLENFFRTNTNKNEELLKLFQTYFIGSASEKFQKGLNTND